MKLLNSIIMKFMNQTSNDIFFINNSIKFLLYYYKTALYIAVEKRNVEIVKLLLKHPKININLKSVLIFFY